MSPPSARARTQWRTSVIALLATTALVGVAVASALPSNAAPRSNAAPGSTPETPKPTIVLVHGAFADASGWSGVTERLQDRGYTVVAPPNPLRGVASDAAYLRSYLTQVKGPIVLVGHSYGGIVITNAATGNKNVKALVYIAAYAPDEGESIGSLSQQVPGGMISPATLTLLPFPLADGTFANEGIITPNVFREIFAADLPEKTTAVMATAQRPGALQTLGEPSGPPAWKAIPSWYLVAGRDNAIGTELERFMAKRIGATTVEAKRASHVVMISRPGLTTRLILSAAHDDHGEAGALQDARRTKASR